MDKEETARAVIRGRKSYKNFETFLEKLSVDNSAENVMTQAYNLIVDFGFFPTGELQKMAKESLEQLIKDKNLK